MFLFEIKRQKSFNLNINISSANRTLWTSSGDIFKEMTKYE